MLHIWLLLLIIIIIRLLLLLQWIERHPGQIWSNMEEQQLYYEPLPDIPAVSEDETKKTNFSSALISLQWTDRASLDSLFHFTPTCEPVILLSSYIGWCIASDAFSFFSPSPYNGSVYVLESCRNGFISLASVPVIDESLQKPNTGTPLE